MQPVVRHSAVLVVICAIVAGLAGCQSDRPERTAAANSPRVARAAPTPEMEAHGTYLDGDLAVDVVLNSAGFAPRGGRSPSVARGGGGGRGGFGGRGGGRRGGGPDEGGRGGSREDTTPAPHIIPSNEPPVRLHLRFTNRSYLPVDIEVPDFNSALGNFVVQPKKITVPPRGSIEAEPMNSTLSVPGDEVPLTVTIRANGRTEKQVLMLRVKAPAPATSPMAPTTPPPPNPPAATSDAR